MLTRDLALQVKLAEARRVLASKGVRLRILDYANLPDAGWLAAADDIIDRGRVDVDPLDANRVIRFLREVGTSTLGRAAELVRLHPEPLDAVLSLVIRPRAVVVEMRGPITPETRLRLRVARPS